MAETPNTPLWLDLALATGAVALAYRLDRHIRPAKPQRAAHDAGPRQVGLDRQGGEEESEDGEERDAIADQEGGAIGIRPSQEPHGLQQERAKERGRGRSASLPTEINVTGWKDVLWRLYHQIQDDRLLAVAAGVVFYMLLALFPALTALVSLYGLFTNPSVIAGHLSLLDGVMPVGAIGILREQVTRLTETSKGGLSFGFVFGLGLALWSANAGMKAIIDALNVVYDEREKRSFVWLTLVAFAFTLGGLLFVILALGAIVVLPLALAWIGLESRGAELVSLLRWPALFVVVMLWLAVLYRYGPSRRRARWIWLGAGSLFATITWLLGSALFSWYLGNFADYDATYGSLGAAIGLMMWLWLSVIVILVGGQLNAEMRDGASDGARHDRAAGKAARQPRCYDGRYDRRGLALRSAFRP
jgi:membrane protein